MMDAIALAAYLDDLNVRAFLAALRLGEGTKGPDGYRTMFTGKLFDSFHDHPRQVNRANGIDSTAAGAYQFLSKTWDGLVKQYGFDDFSPTNQDLACIALIHGRGALDDVVAGRIEQAVAKCNKEWASLPGSPYGQPVVTMAKFLAEYQHNGGMLEPQPLAADPLVQLGPEKPDETLDSPDTSVNSQGELIVKEKPMAPFITAVLPALFEAVPALVRQFGSGSKMAERNAQAVDILVGTAKKAAQAVNEQDLAEKLKDPAVAANVRQAVEANWIQIVEVGGGVDAARKADAAAMASGEPFWKSSPSFWIAVALLPLVYMIVANIVGVLGTPLSDEVRSAIANGVVGLVLGGLIGYYYGQSTSRNRPIGGA